MIQARDLDALCVWGPGHGGPAVVAGPMRPARTTWSGWVMS
ncbi:hypothetical protein AB0D90_28205 [Streptomyces althioticus]